MPEHTACLNAENDLGETQHCEAGLEQAERYPRPHGQLQHCIGSRTHLWDSGQYSVLRAVMTGYHAYDTAALSTVMHNSCKSADLNQCSKSGQGCCLCQHVSQLPVVTKDNLQEIQARDAAEDSTFRPFPRLTVSLFRVILLNNAHMTEDLPDQGVLHTVSHTALASMLCAEQSCWHSCSVSVDSWNQTRLYDMGVSLLATIHEGTLSMTGISNVPM